MKAGEELPRPLKAALDSLACFRAELASSQGQVLAKLDSELEKFHNLQPPTPAHEAGRSPILFLRCAFINKCCGLVVRPWDSHAFCGQALGLLQPPPPLRSISEGDEELSSDDEVRPVEQTSIARPSHFSSRPSLFARRQNQEEPLKKTARASFLQLNKDYAVERLREESINEFGNENIELQEQDRHERRWPMLLKVVRSPHAETVSLAITCLNAIWIALDLEFNDALTVLEADPLFVVVELLFLVYFGGEVVMRYLSYASTRRACRDRWFLFDVILVTLMIVEIWLIPMIGLTSGDSSDSGGGIGDASFLRMLRLVRITRVIRVASYMPEVMIIIKGLTVASRSVFFTFVLLLLITYIFSIAFRQLAQDNLFLESELFPSVPATMLTLIVQCVMPDQEAFFQKVSQNGGWFMGMLVVVFILVSSLIVINMLIGVLVEAVQTVSDVEHEAIQIAFAKRLLREILCDEATQAEGSILTQEEFFSMLERPEAIKGLVQLGVDHVAAKEYGKLLMEDGQPLTFGEFLESMLLLRGSNQTTVKDLVTLRRYVGDQFSHLHDILLEMGKNLSRRLAAAQAEKKEQQLLKEAVKKQSEDVKEALKAGEDAAAIQARLRPRTFVFDFSSGSLDAGVPGSKNMKKRLEDFQDAVSFILHCATEHDEAVVRITSPGGAVIDYGFASAQLMRLRQRGLKLTACVDKVAASGGYMMACTADTIVATPFSLVGSIGVLAALPNFNKVLRRYEVDWLQFTGGRYKRTVDPLSEPTEEGIEKMKQEINTIHDAFKGMVLQQRTHLDMDEVATGEAFLGAEGKERGLVDRLATSDEVLEERMEVSDVIEVSLAEKKRGLRELLEGKMEAAESLVTDCWERATSLGRRGAVELKDPQF
ncbi:sohB [Symbiodinium sp. KB8]|nr:sohB [Symbiodinium sp. KB8]